MLHSPNRRRVVLNRIILHSSVLTLSIACQIKSRRCVLFVAQDIKKKLFQITLICVARQNSLGQITSICTCLNHVDLYFLEQYFQKIARSNYADLYLFKNHVDLYLTFSQKSNTIPVLHFSRHMYVLVKSRRSVLAQIILHS